MKIKITKGFCQCGCGNKTKISKYANPSRNQKAGEPRRYIKGHEHRKSPVDYLIDKKSGCWIWQLSLSNKGYAQTKVNGKTKEAHRLFYKKYKGDISSGMELDHLCRRRNCVNPQHLEPVTHTENMKRSPKVTHLTDRQIKEILKLKGKKTQKIIAGIYNICPQYVGQLFNGKWRRYITI